jgi:hypothetical protein
MQIKGSNYTIFGIYHPLETRLVTKHSHSYTRYAVVISCTLTCTYTRTSLNQVSYLKGSSMESFNLVLIAKLDFTG